MSFNFVAAVTICSDSGAQENEIWHCFHCFPSICHEVMGPDATIFIFWMLSFKAAFSLSSFTFITGSLVPFGFLPLKWYHLHTLGCWYFSQESWFQLVIHPAQHFSWYSLHDGTVNPTIRKDLKTVPKFCCCPIEGCPRGPDRPFSQFSLAKQHCMKVHAEKKHTCKIWRLFQKL